jgi:hypothetical protein
MIQDLIDVSIAITDKYIAAKYSSVKVVMPNYERMAWLRSQARIRPAVGFLELGEVEERMEEVRCEQAREARRFS